MELLTTISSDYVPEWGLYEGVRELIQNGLDASDKGFRFDIVYLRERQELIIYNEGTYLTASNFLLGNTSKRGDETQRGMYGEGFKIGILALIRCGRNVVINNGAGSIITSSFKPHPDCGGADVLCFDVDKSDNILPMDKKKLIFKVEGITPKDVSEIKDKFLHWKGLELGDYYKTDIGKVLLSEEYKGKVFSRGIYVCEIEKLAYGYDFDNLKLGRDRNLASQFDICWETSRMWSFLGSTHSKDDLVMKMLESNSPDIENIKHFSAKKLESSIFDNFVETNGVKSYPCSSEYQKKEVASMGYTPVFVSEPHGDMLKKNMPSLHDLREKKELQTMANVDITQIFFKLIAKGWRIERCSCACGGKYAWGKPRDSGAFEIVGCICHSTPLDIEEI